MKNIEINNKQKENLLEMCKELFPKYYEWKFEDDQLYFTDIKAFSYYLHWFEFCITKIVNDLAWRNIKTDILADCEYEEFRMKLITEIFRDKFTTEKFHIVDYLYEEFKKLK